MQQEIQSQMLFKKASFHENLTFNYKSNIIST